MELLDTLRYFYSAVFQGFAALIGLGIIVFIFWLQLILNRKEMIERNNTILLQSLGSGTLSNYLEKYQSFTKYCEAKMIKGNFYISLRLEKSETTEFNFSVITD